MAAAATLGAVNPLNPGSPLVLQCHSPDLARKTCRALAAYYPVANGGYRNRADVLISNTERLVLRTNIATYVRNDAICGITRRNDILNADLISGGESDLDAKKALAVIADGYAKNGLFDHEICTRYEAETGTAVKTAKVSIDGVYRPAFDQPVIWIAADAGYVVGL